MSWNARRRCSPIRKIDLNKKIHKNFKVNYNYLAAGGGEALAGADLAGARDLP
jgi:hypothetical protein